MALKVKLENQDVDTSKVDIPLFATADDAVKDIKLDEKTVIKINVEDPNKIGYTNSREYLKKYLESIYHNIIELIKNLNPFNEKLVIMHNNLLCDFVLKY